MGNTPPKAPKKTDKEIQREMTRIIDRQIRDFDSERRKIDFQIKKSTRDLKTMIAKGETKASQKILATQILRSQGYVRKYSALEGQMKALRIQLASASTTQAMVGIMQQMGKIMGKTTNGLNVNNVQRIIEEFTIQQEKQESLNEMMEDAMDMDFEGNEDEEVEKLINETATGNGTGSGGKQQFKQQQAIPEDESLDTLIKDLKK